MALPSSRDSAVARVMRAVSCAERKETPDDDDHHQELDQGEAGAQGGPAGTVSGCAHHSASPSPQG